ncbi:stage III sporulation protein AG [Shouchella lonarensis]|uniref:Stage III sporulation protein AG n=1 Tax=Shouchella lonarensis TaxID=1464122 RepID=A0A1G6IDD0_9BACI|nr:stage III sporulation protein AG [Shouchella lonarensis]SDC04552.1 stage III sporulation protein AG [Shouchella lonarensis]
MKHERKDDDWFKKWLEKQPQKKKRTFSPKYILLLGCGGVFLMIASQFFQPEQEKTLPVIHEEGTTSKEVESAPTFGREVESNSMTDYEMRYENQLREMLEEMVGVDDVSVFINVADTEKHIYQNNVNRSRQDTKETDREGGSRQVEDVKEEEAVVILREGDKEKPLVVATEKPDVAGVLVVANGVENVQVKAWVVEAVSRVLDVPVHRVSVMPKKLKEE